MQLHQRDAGDWPFDAAQRATIRTYLNLLLGSQADGFFQSAIDKEAWPST
jgi:hypothetical protein